jgi:hypothetical protein
MTCSPVNSFCGTDKPEGMVLEYTLGQREGTELLDALPVNIDSNVYILCHKKEIVFYGEKKDLSFEELITAASYS